MLISGGISIACNANGVIRHIQPLCNKDFEYYTPSMSCVIRFRIGDMVKNLTKCQYVYPDIDKVEAFSKFSTNFIKKPQQNYMMLTCPNCLNRFN